MTMDKFLAGKKRLESINTDDYSSRIKGSSFEDRHKRVTLYLELPLYNEIQELRQAGKITNMTCFANQAIRFFLDEHPL